jgi:hypothetical protein
MSRSFSIVAIMLLGFNAEARTDATLLESIAQVESGMNRKAIGKAGERGMYQINQDAWKDACDRLESEGHYHFQWSQWRQAIAQDMIAAAHLRILREHFAKVGITSPTPEQIALAWNKGFTGAKAMRWQPNDYAIRVGNLFRLSSAQR